MSDPADRKHLFALFAAKHDGTITPAQHVELESLLQQSAGARLLWFLSCDIEAGLANWAEGEHARRSLPSVPVLGNAPAGQHRPRRNLVRIILVVLLVLGLVLAGLFIVHLSRSSVPSADGDIVSAEEPRSAPLSPAGGLRSRRFIAEDPATLAYYLFDPSPESATRLANSAPRTGAFADGEILGPAWTEGRWPWKRALHFTAPSHGVTLNIPDPMSEVTFGAWIKIDSLPGSLHMLCGSTVPEVGAVRWEITRDGRLRFAVAVRRRDDLLLWEADNSPPLLAKTGDRWVFVVSTLAQKRLRHYVNGRLVRDHPLAYPEPFRLDAGHVGRLPETPGRFFSGAMDELFILSRALTDAEIAELHRLGRP